MSAINGDKARFNKDRKSKIARRARNRKTFGNLKTQAPSKASAAKVSAERGDINVIGRSSFVDPQEKARAAGRYLADQTRSAL
jgi:hypothetical protein